MSDTPNVAGAIAALSSMEGPLGIADGLAHALMLVAENSPESGALHSLGSVIVQNLRDALDAHQAAWECLHGRAVTFSLPEVPQ